MAISVILTGLIVYAAVVQVQRYHEQNLSAGKGLAESVASPVELAGPKQAATAPVRSNENRDSSRTVADPLSQVRTVVELAGALDLVEGEEEIVPLGYYSSRDGSTPEETAEFFEKMTGSDGSLVDR